MQSSNPIINGCFGLVSVAMLHKLLHHIAQANGCKLSIIAHTAQTHRVRELVKPRLASWISMLSSWSTFLGGGTQRKIQEKKQRKQTVKIICTYHFCVLHAEREKQNLDLSSCRGISYILQTNKFIFIHIYISYVFICFIDFIANFLTKNNVSSVRCVRVGSQVLQPSINCRKFENILGDASNSIGWLLAKRLIFTSLQ